MNEGRDPTDKNYWAFTTKCVQYKERARTQRPQIPQVFAFLPTPTLQWLRPLSVLPVQINFSAGVRLRFDCILVVKCPVPGGGWEAGDIDRRIIPSVCPYAACIHCARTKAYAPWCFYCVQHVQRQPVVLSECRSIASPHESRAIE